MNESLNAKRVRVANRILDGLSNYNEDWIVHFTDSSEFDLDLTALPVSTEREIVLYVLATIDDTLLSKLESDIIEMDELIGE